LHSPQCLCGADHAPNDLAPQSTIPRRARRAKRENLADPCGAYNRLVERIRDSYDEAVAERRRYERARQLPQWTPLPRLALVPSAGSMRPAMRCELRSIIPGLLIAGIALALSLPAAGQGAGVRSSRGVPPSVIQVPQTPPPPILNPGVKPSAPGPSQITPSPRSSAGLATTVLPGPALGTGPPPQPRGQHHRQPRRSPRPMNEMEREIERDMSICRGC
jgi:hypothetical protein